MIAAPAGMARVTIGGAAGVALGSVPSVARERAEPFVWLLRDGVEPEGPVPADLLSDSWCAVAVPVGADGAPREEWMGTLTDEDLDAAISGATDGRAPLRLAPLASLVVPREALVREAPADEGRYGPYADLEWTARLFRRAPGMLCVAHRVVVPPRRVPLAPASLARLLTADAMRATDALRVGRLARQRSS